LKTGKYAAPGDKRGGFGAMGLRFLFWLFALLLWEGLLHSVAFDGFSWKFGYVLGFSAAYAAVISLVLSFLPLKAERWTALGLTLAGVALYGSQLVYDYVFGTLYSVAQMDQGGAAMTSFWRETLATIAAHLFPLVLLFAPTALLALLWKKGIRKADLSGRLAAAVLAAACFVGTVFGITGGGEGMFSDAYYYRSTAIATQQMADRFGLLTTMRLELFDVSEAGDDARPEYYIPVPEPQPPAEPGETLPLEEQVTYNVLPVDFEELNALTEEEKLLALNAYISALPGTNRNDYTGLLADYNLIVLCAESFSTAAIHPEVTPTLYRLSREGILFENYYNSFPNTTTDGEYALVQGLYPDSSRNKMSSSLYASRGSYLPFAMGNAMNTVTGGTSFGYHNYKGDYYGRDESHPNMGYTMKFAGSGMTFSNAWPASDLEMLEQSVDDYIGQEQFHAYYMTFSGHYRYDRGTNLIAKQNWDVVSHLPYSDTCKAYLSCNVELDRALEYLMKRLEEAGIAERTAIVVAGDHYPYGLTDKQYSELVGYEVDELSKFKDTLIFWVGGLEENIVVEEYCCNVDILPTILNLWGVAYDSRMLSGTDVFSDGTHVAVLSDRSFLTEDVWFNAAKGEAFYPNGEQTVAEGYIEGMNQLIATRFAVSSDILQTAYYDFVFHKEIVKVNTRSWGSNK